MRHFCPLLVVISLTLSSCTHITVTKVDPDDGKPGIRYSLPIRVLIVTPKKDGTLDVSFDYLPDPQNTYAVETFSFLAHHSLTFKTDRGLLTEVNWSGDSSAVAAEAVKAAGTVAGAREDARIAAEKAETARIEKDEDKRKAERAELVAALAKARTAEAIAQAEYDTLESGGASAAEILKARVKLKGAAAEREALEVRLNTLASGRGVAPGRAGTETGPIFSNVPGPMAFRVVEDTNGKGVRLVMTTWETRPVPSGTASPPQQDFDTYLMPSAGTPNLLPETKTLTATPNDLGDLSVTTTNVSKIITVNLEFDSFTGLPIVLNVDNGLPVANELIPKLEKQNSKHFEIVFPKGYAPARYLFEVGLNRQNKPLGKLSIRFKAVQ